MRALLVTALVVAVGIAILVAWGWIAGLMYAFLAVVAAVVTTLASRSHGVVTAVSRRRFAK
jgi:multidrug resistance efflux pump